MFNFAECHAHVEWWTEPNCKAGSDRGSARRQGKISLCERGIASRRGSSRTSAWKGGRTQHLQSARSGGNSACLSQCCREPKCTISLALARRHGQRRRAVPFPLSTAQRSDLRHHHQPDTPVPASRKAAASLPACVLMSDLRLVSVRS